MEYHIQKALVTISAEERQEFIYERKTQVSCFFRSYNGDAHHMGASKRVELVIR